MGLRKVDGKGDKKFSTRRVDRAGRRPPTDWRLPDRPSDRTNIDGVLRAVVAARRPALYYIAVAGSLDSSRVNFFLFNFAMRRMRIKIPFNWVQTFAIRPTRRKGRKYFPISFVSNFGIKLQQSLFAEVERASEALSGFLFQQSFYFLTGGVGRLRRIGRKEKTSE